MRLLLIANPAAGRGKTRALTHSFVSELRALGGRPVLKWSEAPGHAHRIAREGDDVDVVVAVGGDGTVHEVAAGLIAAGRHLPLAVAPFGSGNDFARLLGMPDRPRHAAEAIIQMNHADFDYGVINWTTQDSSGSDIFVNALGCGFDAFVADEVRHTRFGRGLTRYVVTALRSIRKWNDPRVRITFGTKETMEWEGPLLLCTAGIGTSSGGGFLLTPAASPTDGVFDVCIAEAMPLHRILYVLPLALRGRHLRVAGVILRQTSVVALSSHHPIPVHLDGEIISRHILSFEARIEPQGLRVLTGYEAANGDLREHR